MTPRETEIPGVLVLEPRVFEDSRGFFMETYHRDRFREMGIHADFLQDNHSRSARGTLRGLHYQVTQPQAKLCRVIAGRVLDVAVDVRLGSPTFGKWTSVELSAENRLQIFIPRGFAHGFLVLSEYAEFVYKCDAFYDAAGDRGVRWDDPTLQIEWGNASPLLSPKDQTLPMLAEAPPGWLPVWTP